jgi:hypothetical protein
MFLEPKLIKSADGGVLLDVEGDQLLKLNLTAVQFWEELSAGKTDDQIADTMCAQHSVSRKQVKEDLQVLKARISELGLTMPSLQNEETVVKAGTFVLPNFPWYAGKREGLTRRSNPLLTACALAALFAFDCLLSLQSMKGLCRFVKRFPARKKDFQTDQSLLPRICFAVERACVWYPKKALCLQRSAVTTCMLRWAGVPAEMVLGAQPMPLQAHAWVEVNGAVINDHLAVKNVYGVLDRY